LLRPSDDTPILVFSEKSAVSNGRAIQLRLLVIDKADRYLVTRSVEYRVREHSRRNGELV
jgi:hypothetical protein